MHKKKFKKCEKKKNFIKVKKNYENFLQEFKNDIFLKDTQKRTPDFSYDFNLKIQASELIEQGKVKKITHLKNSQYLLQTENSILIFDLDQKKIEKTKKILDKGKRGIIDFWVNKNNLEIWVSFYDGLYVFDSEMSFLAKIGENELGKKKKLIF